MSVAFFFPIRSNLYFILSSQTDAHYPPVIFSSSLINGVLNHSAFLSLPFVSPQFFILLLLIFFLEILSIMLFFIYQDEVRHPDGSPCVMHPVSFCSWRSCGKASFRQEQGGCVSAPRVFWSSYKLCCLLVEKGTYQVTFSINDGFIKTELILFWFSEETSLGSDGGKSVQSTNTFP